MKRRPKIKTVEPGEKFEVLVPADVSLEQLRKEAKERFGLDIFVRVKVGPTKIRPDTKGLDCPIAAVDDKFLEGKFKFPIPAEGFCIYRGYFLPRT